MAPSTRLEVIDGRVDCPNRGNIVVDVCLFCEHLTSVDLDHSTPVIFCRPPARRTAQKTAGRPRSIRRSTPSPRGTLVAPELRRAILDLSLRHPRWGAQRVAAALRSRGTHVSARKVAQVLDSEGLMYAHQRMDRLEQLVLQGRIEPDEEQIRALERYDPCFQERGRTGTRPGERILVFTCGPVAAGRSADGIGIPAYAHFAIDTCTGMTFGLVQAGNSALGRELLIQAEVLPFFKRHGYSVVQVDHLGQRAPRSPFVTRMLKEVLPAWLQSTPGHTEVTVGELQHRLDAVLDQYNHRPLEGFPNLGQPPICRLRAATEGGKENRARMQK